MSTVISETKSKALAVGGVAQVVPSLTNPASSTLAKQYSAVHAAPIALAFGTTAYTLVLPKLAFITSFLFRPTTAFTGGSTPSIQAGSAAPLATPVAPVITTNGTAGVTTYTYKVVALLPDASHSIASAAGSTTTGNATLSAGNSNNVTFTAVTGASSYDIYRTVGGATQGKIGNVLAGTVVLIDTGLAGDAATAPTTNTTGLDLMPSTVLSAAATVIPTNPFVNVGDGDDQTVFVTITGSPAAGAGYLLVDYANL